MLWVEKEDGHSWELCGVASALGQIYVFLRKTKVDESSADSLCPCKVYLKVVGDMVAKKSLYGGKHHADKGRNSAGGSHRNFLSLYARYWSCHVIPIQDADFLGLC